MVLEIGSASVAGQAAVGLRPAASERVPIFGPQALPDPNRDQPLELRLPTASSGDPGRRSGAGAQQAALGPPVDDATSVAATSDAVREFSENAAIAATRLSILFDDASRQFVSRSVAVESGEVVDQFPQEAVLRRIAAVVEQLAEQRVPRVDISV